jgi:hypothetical protein
VRGKRDHAGHRSVAAAWASVDILKRDRPVTDSLTWVRQDVGLGDSKLIEELADFLVSEGVASAERSARKLAIAHVVELRAHAAVSRLDGLVGEMKDHRIEQWVDWEGAPGRFAQYVRQHFVDDRGCLLDWGSIAGVEARKRDRDRRAKKAQRDREIATVGRADDPPDNSVDVSADDAADIHALRTDERTTKRHRATDLLDFTPPDWVPAAEWAEFVEMRRKKKKPLTPRAAAGIVRDLEVLRTKGYDLRAVLAKSVDEKWLGVFELKGPSSRQDALTQDASAALAAISAQAAQIRADTLAERRAGAVTAA